jgi:histidinol-phosphate aminotransferase
MVVPFTKLVQSLPASVPFVGPETQERARGAPFRARLGANESVFGPSPAAVEAMAQAASECWMYGDPEMHTLKAALAEATGLAPEGVVVGEGIDGLLGVAARLFLEPGAVAVTSRGAYPTFVYHVNGLGARIEAVPYRDDHEDIEALAAKARETGARIVYLSNPDNPMGTWRSGADIAALPDALPEGCMLFLDEAYGEFAPDDARAPIAADDPRVIRFRTFSKGYGMAGLRVGYALAAPEVARSFDKIRNHFGVGRIAQAGALAALADRGWLESVVARVAAGRARIAAIAAENGLRALPSAANFVAVDCGRDGDYARAVLAEMSRAASSSACPAWRRSTAASGSPSERRPISPSWRRRCPKR